MLQRDKVEDTFEPLGIAIRWIDFQYGPSLLEAINVGSVDFGFVGDLPTIFAQAGSAKIRYVAAVKSEGTTRAIIVPANSPIKTLADLKGKRVAFARGSSAHNLLVATLEKTVLRWKEAIFFANQCGFRSACPACAGTHTNAPGNHRRAENSPSRDHQFILSRLS